MWHASVLPLVALGAGLARAVAFEPSAHASVLSSNDRIETDIQIEIEGPQGLSVVDLTALNVTCSSCNASVFHATPTPDCQWPNSTAIRITGASGTSSRPAVAPAGFFVNSTASPLAAGTFQAPSRVDFAPFSGGSCVTAQKQRLFAWLAVGVSSVLFTAF